MIVVTHINDLDWLCQIDLAVPNKNVITLQTGCQLAGCSAREKGVAEQTAVLFEIADLFEVCVPSVPNFCVVVSFFSRLTQAVGHG